ncbi:MAG: hypothetical protein ACP5I8_00995, partial [Phycisphaerae bacterium]
TNNSPFTLTDVTLTVNYTLDGEAESVSLTAAGIYSGSTKTWLDGITHPLGDAVVYGGATISCDQNN